MNNSANVHLWGIQAIADYMDCSVGYVVEQHKTNNLPYMIRSYPSGVDRAWTTKAMIDNWLLAQSRAHSDLLKAKRAKRAELTAHAKEKD